ncbi:unnamed protein product [Urochloa decumbens]|uniref:RING-type E3 ubiquitin transferase n=1 Tax=Urochloa decumbens TaxID=240449 RepID=A0ABC8ZY25_9POAL
MDSSCPSGAAAVAPTAPVAAAAGAAGGVLTIGSVAIVAGTLLIFVLIGAGLVFLHYVFDARRDDDRGRRRRGAQASRRRGGSGVDPDVLRSLPVTVYRAGAPPGSEKDAAVECAVCLAELEDGAAARFLPRCGHGFHAACVDAWLACHVTCPLCRLAVVAKPDVSSPPPASALLPAAPPEPANYAANMPASVLLRVSDQGAVSMASGGDTDVYSPAGATGILVIDIPELAVPTSTPRDAAKSPGLAARPRSFRRQWSFGKQAAGPSSSCSCGAGAGEGDDVEQGISVTIGVAVMEAQLSPGAAAGAIKGSAV